MPGIRWGCGQPPAAGLREPYPPGATVAASGLPIDQDGRARDRAAFRQRRSRRMGMNTMNAVAGPATTWRPAKDEAGAEPQRQRGLSAESERTARATTDARIARWGVAAVLLLLGYEWLVSG